LLFENQTVEPIFKSTLFLTDNSVCNETCYGAKDMRAAVLKEPRRFVIEEKPIPELKKGEALIKVHAAGICGSDLHFYTGELPLEQESIRGHEIAGEIADPGDTDFKPGQPVVVHPLIGCGACPACVSGSWHLCENLKAIGGHYPGGFSEYVAVPAKNIYAFNAESLSFSHAALADCVAVAVHAVNRAGLCPGESVIVMGDGTIGLFLVQAAVSSGADSVVLIGKHEKNLDMAKAFGASAVFNSIDTDSREWILKTAGKVDVVFEAAGGKSPPLGVGADLLKSGWRMAVLGLTGTRKIGIPWFDFVLQEKSFFGVMGYSMFGKEDEMKKALSLMESEQVVLEPIITHRVPLNMIEQGFEAMLNKAETICIKAVVLHNG